MTSPWLPSEDVIQLSEALRDLKIPQAAGESEHARKAGRYRQGFARWRAHLSKDSGWVKISVPVDGHRCVRRGHDKRLLRLGVLQHHCYQALVTRKRAKGTDSTKKESDSRGESIYSATGAE